MTCIWIGGGDYPNGGHEFILWQDIKAANIVFSSSMEVWQIPRILYKQFATSLAELQLKVRPCGDIGKYLFDQTVEFNNNMQQFSTWPHGEIWTLGDEGCVCALLEEAERNDGYEMIEAPCISEKDMTYTFGTGYRPIRVYKKMDFCWVPLDEIKNGVKVYPLELIPYIIEPRKEIVHFVSKQI